MGVESDKIYCLPQFSVSVSVRAGESAVVGVATEVEPAGLTTVNSPESSCPAKAKWKIETL